MCVQHHVCNFFQKVNFELEFFKLQNLMQYTIKYSCYNNGNNGEINEINKNIFYTSALMTPGSAFTGGALDRAAVVTNYLRISSKTVVLMQFDRKKLQKAESTFHFLAFS
jgi:hypothetical protein